MVLRIVTHVTIKVLFQIKVFIEQNWDCGSRCSYHCSVCAPTENNKNIFLINFLFNVEPDQIKHIFNFILYPSYYLIKLHNVILETSTRKGLTCHLTDWLSNY